MPIHCLGDFGTRGIFSINRVFPLVFAVTSLPLIWSAGAAIGDSALAFVIDDGRRKSIWIPMDSRIGDRHGASCYFRRCAVAGDINTMTAAADASRSPS